MMWTVVFLGVLGVSMANGMMPEYQSFMLQLHNEGRYENGQGSYPFMIYVGGLYTIESGPDNPVINSMSIDLHNWEPMTWVNQVSQADHPIPLIAFYDKLSRTLQQAEGLLKRWNEDLAREAQRYANTCQFRYSSRPEYGQNLYIEQSSRSEEEFMSRGFQAWRNGANSYRFGDSECSPYQTCYYSQVGWEQTREFGCAMNNCPYMSQFQGYNGVRYLVCYYQRWGNWMGEEAYEPGK